MISRISNQAFYAGLALLCIDVDPVLYRIFSRWAGVGEVSEKTKQTNKQNGILHGFKSEEQPKDQSKDPK